jgi:hypothetical protein
MSVTRGSLSRKEFLRRALAVLGLGLWGSILCSASLRF